MAVNSVNSMFSNFVKGNFKGQGANKADKTEKSNELFSVQKNENTDKAELSGLSEKARAYLAKLEEKFDNINFVIGDSSDKNAGMGSGKDYNCFMSADLLERMADSEEVAEKYEGIIEDAIVKVDELKQSVEEKGLSQHVKSYGVKVNDDGSVDYMVMLNDSVKGLYEKKAEEKPEHKKLDKGYKSADSPKKLTAGSIEELLEKLSSARIEAYLEKHNHQAQKPQNPHNSHKEFSYIKGRRDGFDETINN